MKKILLIFSLLLAGCYDEDELTKPIYTNSTPSTHEPLEYLNEYREKSGLNPFTLNPSLSRAAKNHAIYIIKNKHQGHDEIENTRYFTGSTPQKRAIVAGYKSKLSSENISFKKDPIKSIDSLFTAIYHRFGFLDMSKDEVGFAHESFDGYNATVFVMGNAQLDDMCKNGGDLDPQKYYKNVCKHENIKIEANRFKNAVNKASTSRILFPSNLEQEAMIYFSGEKPDPAPECKILSNPVSVNFAPFMSDIKMKSFKLYGVDGEIKDTKIITKENDINKKFTEHQFALFALKPFKFGQEYRAVFTYQQGVFNDKIQWSFKTKEPKYDYFYVQDGGKYAIKPNKYYDIFFMPNDCNDVITKYSYTGFMNFKVKQIGANFLRIKADGFKGNELNFKANNKELTFVLTESSKNKKNYPYIGIFLLFLAIIIALYKVKK